ncbi:uncharacterized protein N7459_005858 [Penicillium hispanicum]|uniref:uncharacterized protein n=1 Tax=Penicillium hispanicum TaxID=1080232 RepID=UPI00253FDDB2|nr:uncharacterized protein N7459_005858 [Penicillium hispanicum]KAJ5579873.1 hypothetical protein N7459_005858 [Penicillium hispanicum]
MQFNQRGRPIQLSARCVVSGLLHFFSRKERAKRKQQAEQRPVALQVPSAYKPDFYEAPAGSRSAYPRPLSSFAPDYRQSQYYPPSQHPQLPRASVDARPPQYPTLPTYDPSKYQPIRAPSTPGADLPSYLHPPARAPSSRLSAVHYNARLSIYQPSVADRPFAPPMPRETVASHARTRSVMPSRPSVSVEQHPPRPGEGRERSISEPMPMPAGPIQGTRGSSRAKPVLSRLITNFG